MRAIYADNRIEFTTGYRINVSKWNESAQRIKNGCTNRLKQTASETNTDLNDYSTAIHNIFKEFEIIEVIPTTEQLKAAFNKKIRKDTQSAEEIEQKMDIPDFWNIFDNFVKECGVQNEWTDVTYEKFAATKKAFTRF